MIVNKTGSLCLHGNYSEGKDYLVGKCHGAEKRIPAVDLALKCLEGWLEAALVEMEKSYRGKVQSGRVW